MASTITKKFGQFRQVVNHTLLISQWTGERLGTERKTEAANEFKNLSAETELRKEGLENLHGTLVVFLKTFGLLA